MAGSKSDVPAKGFHVNSSAWDLERFKNTAKYDKKVEAIFNQAVQEASMIASNLDINPDKPFSFSDYPQTNARVNKLFSSFSRNYTSIIDWAVKEEWQNAAQKNDEFVKSILDTSKLTKKQTDRYFQRNLEALHAFQQRKIDGTFTLSDRIWKLQGQFKSELEMGLDIGLGEGRSAQQLSQDIRQNLKDPDRLFRRVRDKHGNLQLSKHAKAFHPGQGVYRSSAKNALRLTRSEANIAYLTSDHLRWQQLDFVVGFDVVTSNNHPQEDICDHLKGRYPKSFVFKGWHVLCRCRKVAVLANAEEFNKAEQILLDGGDISNYPYSNKVESLPNNFTSWINDNKDRIASAKSLPYFISDNISKNKTIYSIITSEGSSASLNNMNKIVNKKTSELYDKIAEKENEIRMNKKFETAVVFDDEGNIVFEKKGEQYSIAFTNNEVELFKDKIFTHNHPRGWESPDGSMGRIGNSFSPADILIAINSDIKEIRAVTPNFTFIMVRPSSGWGLSLGEARSCIERINNDLRAQFGDRIYNKTTTVGKANAVHYHTLWKIFGERYGFKYSKIKTA